MSIKIIRGKYLKYLYKLKNSKYCPDTNNPLHSAPLFRTLQCYIYIQNRAKIDVFLARPSRYQKGNWWLSIKTDTKASEIIVYNYSHIKMPPRRFSYLHITNASLLLSKHVTFFLFSFLKLFSRGQFQMVKKKKSIRY